MSNNPYVGKKAVQILRTNLDRFIGPGKKFSSNAAAHAASGVGATTIHRARNELGEMGVEKLGLLAHAIGVEPWELLHPDLRPDSRPRDRLENPEWPLKGIEPEEFMLVPDYERDEVIDMLKAKVKRHRAIKSAKEKAA